MMAQKKSTARSRAITVYRAAAPVVRKGASAAAKAAIEERHTLAAVLAALAIGYAERTGIAIPEIPGVGVAGTVGLAAWVLGRGTRSRVARHVATGALSIAAYQLGKQGSTV